MKAFSRLRAMALLLLAGMLSTPAAWAAPDGPPGGGLKLYVAKKTYRVGEPVRLLLYKHAGVDDTPANLEGSYYLIESRQGNHGREFFTSDREPFGTTLDLETELRFRWDQWDNERTHRARPGQWRVRFFAPKGNISKPLEAYFTIQ
jgi:hypothetical protein